MEIDQAPMGTPGKDNQLSIDPDNIVTTKCNFSADMCENEPITCSSITPQHNSTNEKSTKPWDMCENEPVTCFNNIPQHNSTNG